MTTIPMVFTISSNWFMMDLDTFIKKTPKVEIHAGKIEVANA
jgi:hypothetical protein